LKPTVPIRPVLRYARPAGLLFLLSSSPETPTKFPVHCSFINSLVTVCDEVSWLSTSRRSSFLPETFSAVAIGGRPRTGSVVVSPRTTTSVGTQQPSRKQRHQLGRKKTGAKPSVENTTTGLFSSLWRIQEARCVNRFQAGKGGDRNGTRNVAVWIRSRRQLASIPPS